MQARLAGVEFPEDEEEPQSDSPSKPASSFEEIASRAKEKAREENERSPRPDFGMGMGYKQV
jgi:hypothetical protein